jgi:NAD(P)H-hydrate epimerase
MTVTFAGLKVGLLTYPGAWHSGEIVVADIGIPEAASRHIKPVAFLDCWLHAWSEFGWGRPPDFHKGDFGHVAIVASSVGMTGAATLSAEGALRIGTGLVTVLVPESLNDVIEVKLTEAMTIPVPQGKARAFGTASLDKVLGYVNRWDAAVIGPGFGRDEDTIEFTLELIRRLEKPAIIDADALYAISKDLSVLKRCKAPLVVTPHPGEMATLLGTTSADVQSNRLEVARAFAKEHGVTVVLKGAGTVIAAPDGKAHINTTGSPGMATGGTGDVLSGMIGGLLAQDKEPVDAAAAAVYLHGLAGEIASERLSEPAMLASDLANSIGDAIKEVQEEAQQ